MLEYSEIKPGKYIVYNGEPYEVIDSHVARTQQRKPQNQTKLRSLLSGRVISVSFHAAEKVDEADIEKRPIKFIYRTKPGLPAGRQGEFVFCEVNDPSKRFSLPESLVGERGKFLKGNTIIDILTFAGDDEEEEPKVIGVKLPIKVDLAVKDAPPAIKGNTASGGGKLATLETGAVVTVPFFVEAGDVVRVNTETGEYVERVGK